MTWWLPFSGSVSPTVSSTFFPSIPSTPPSKPGARFPAPPPRPSFTLSPTLHDMEGSSSKKRERGWLPRSNSDPSSLSLVDSTPVFDTPSAYLGAAAGMLEQEVKEWHATGSSFPVLESDGDDREDGRAEGLELEEPPCKKRKGIAGIVLSGALDAAIFTTALGFSAYQLWKNPPPASEQMREDDVDKLLAARTRRNVASGSHGQPPPPYQENPPTSPKFKQASPSLITRRIRHVHVPSPARPRPSSRRSSFPPETHPTSENGAKQDSRPAIRRHPHTAPLPSSSVFLTAQHLLPDPLPSFEPFIPAVDEGAEDEDEDEDDPMIQEMNERIRLLIENGREALMSGISLPADPNPTMSRTKSLGRRNSQKARRARDSLPSTPSQLSKSSRDIRSLSKPGRTCSESERLLHTSKGQAQSMQTVKGKYEGER